MLQTLVSTYMKYHVVYFDYQIFGYECFSGQIITLPK